jgi:hypothetical protein
MKSFFVQKIKNAPKISKRLVYGIGTDLGSAGRQLNVFTLFVGFGVVTCTRKIGSVLSLGQMLYQP